MLGIFIVLSTIISELDIIVSGSCRADETGSLLSNIQSALRSVLASFIHVTNVCVRAHYLRWGDYRNFSFGKFFLSRQLDMA